MDTGCGCGCDGKEVKKAKVPAVKNAQYNTYVKFIKKVLKDEGGAAGLKNLIDAGNGLPSMIKMMFFCNCPSPKLK